MNSWIAFCNILKKDIKNYYLKPPNISWGIIFPLSWTLMQLIRTPQAQDINIRELLPGLVFLRPISYCLPLTYGADMLNSSITNNGNMNVWLNFLVLIGFSVLLFYYCRWSIKRKWIL